MESIIKNITKTIIAKTVDDTTNAGLTFGATLKDGAVVAFYGTLGAGKTTFIKGVAKALKIEDEVTSPTFCLISEYSGALGESPIKLYHIDAYRLDSPEAFFDLGCDDFMGQKGTITLIEWANKVEPALPQDATKIDIALDKDGGRTITIKCPQAL